MSREGVVVRISRKSLLISGVILLLFFVGVTYELPYYIYKPGMVDSLDHVVEIEEGNESEGHMHLVTVSGSQATPIQYIAAKLLSYHEIMPLNDVRPEGMSDKEYMHQQLMMMEGSQNTSKYVAYKAANKKAELKYDGVYVMNVVEDMPAEEKLEVGDEIEKVDGRKIKEAKDLTSYVGLKKPGEEVTFSIIREEEELNETIELTSFQDDTDKVGVGIQLVTEETVDVEPEIHFSSGNIGGPSAGFIFALEIYNQLTKADITKGYEIVGTGEIDYEGNIHRIGGIDKKVVAAHRAGIDLFFAPSENGKSDSNYIVAKHTAESLDTDMEIIPVETFDDALEYLDELDPK